ncbi:hypothetical protein [Aliikangiella maris]|uniref:Uncharacterized protein n=2 Tax=Aliikangiella maris TaxID=3162458 RepID=A0ABV3MK88_9GAMM
MKTKINHLLKILPIITGSLLFSSNSFAGDEAVNCRTETFEVPVYAGWAYCTAYYDNKSYPLSEYFSRSESGHEYISDYIRDQYGTMRNVGCWANVPFSHVESIPGRICDHTPKASITIYRHEGSTSITVYVNGTDRDGQIQLKELWVNGVKKSSSSFTSLRSADTSLSYSPTSNKLIIMIFNNLCFYFR